MNEPQSNAGLGRDALGLLLIVVGVFFGVFTVMAMLHPQEHPNDTSAAFMALVNGVGPVAALFLSAGILVVGVRLWIAGISGRIARDLFGVLVTTVTLAILMGAASNGLGGSVGDLLGGVVTRRLTIFVGIPYGLAFVLLPAWFLWLRPRELFAWDETSPAGQASPRVADTGSSQASAPAHHRTTDSSGVSAAEAAALLPPTPAPRKPVAPAPSPTTPVHPLAAPSADVAKPTHLPRNNAPSPYPVDVRVHGGIPEGARPLEATHARTVQDSPPHTPAVQRGLARETSAPQQPARAHLAGSERDVVLERSPVRPTVAGDEVRQAAPSAPSWAEIPVVVEPLAAPAPPAPAAREPVAQELDDEPDDEVDLDVAFAEQVEEPEAIAPAAPPAPDVTPFSATPPAPSWEQPGLFEEPVDAYGTPLSLVEELRKSNTEVAARLEDAAPVAEVAADAPEVEDEPVHELKPAPRGLFDEPLAASAEPRERAQLEDDDEDDELDADDRADRAALAEAQQDEEPDDDADEMEADEEPVEAAELRVVVDETVEVDVEVAEVVLQPQAPPAPRAEVPASKPKRQLAVDELVYRAGCLFLERQRVAVSMLQRDFGLDFKAATEVLDQLQKAGLIGPYLGGQRRDILITREQWDELVGVS
jgi:S-DNA-T family DNA segregation ATPase FtsK/SpoIIIE